MKKFTIIIGVLLILFHALTELHSILFAANPTLANKEVDPFLKKDFSQPILFLWYIKFLADDILWCISYFCMALIAHKYSQKVFLIVCVYFVYHIIDQFLFMYNYKRTYAVYWVMLAASIISIMILLWPMKKKGLYKAME